MSYSAYPQRGCLRGRPFVPYTVVSTILFILFVWYIYDPPTDGPIEKMDEDHPISHVKVSLRPDAHLCNPDDAMGYTLPASSQARCLDGSLPMFYLRKGTGEGKNKWLIYFEGGGWCFDLPACKARAKTVLGSSNDYPRCLSKGCLLYLNILV